MKKYLTIIISLSFYLCTAFAQEDIPQLNQQIVNYVSTTIGMKVNRGECWDLASEALNRNNADWDMKYEYGERYNPKKEDVFPGDLIQFENVTVEYKKGRVTYTETMGHHTAIVYRVIDQEQKILELAHQNTDFSGRKVGLSEFNLDNVTKGKIMFYRPVPLD